MIENSLQHSLEQSLATTTFDPEDLELADVFLGSELRPTVAPGAPEMISAGLNSADLSFVYLNIDPPGEAVLAREPDGPRARPASPGLRRGCCSVCRGLSGGARRGRRRR